MKLPAFGVLGGYATWLADLKSRIRDARVRAALAVISELIGLYWGIGRDIIERQAEEVWGSKVVDRLATDVRAESPESRGFSRSNIHHMRAFADVWQDDSIVQRVVRQLPWGQNIELLGIKGPVIRLWYAQATLHHGWSRPVLALQIETRLGLILCREHNRVVVEYALRRRTGRGTADRRGFSLGRAEHRRAVG